MAEKDSEKRPREAGDPIINVQRIVRILLLIVGVILVIIGFIMRNNAIALGYSSEESKHFLDVAQLTFMAGIYFIFFSLVLIYKSSEEKKFFGGYGKSLYKQPDQMEEQFLDSEDAPELIEKMLHKDISLDTTALSSAGEDPPLERVEDGTPTLEEKIVTALERPTGRALCPVCKKIVDTKDGYCLECGEPVLKED